LSPEPSTSSESPRAAVPTWRVFLSSTAVDLTAHRDAVEDAILRLKNLPVRMETFGAVPNMPVPECEARVRESDALVVIVAHRYGWVPSPAQGGRDGKSITWIEVEAALGRKPRAVPVLAFVVDDAHPWTELKEESRLKQPDVLADPAKITAVARSVEDLLRFKAWLKNDAGLTVDSFSTPADLALKVTAALANWALERHTSRGDLGAGSDTVPLPLELRICHPLQPAPHFQGRTSLVDDLVRWWGDSAHPDRVRALVAAGGTGKTAIVEQVLRRARSLEFRGHVLVWSFYETPNADAFLREACDLFLGEREGYAGGRLERLARGLREGNRPHLLVLDGLERLQAEAREGNARGEIEDHSLRMLLRSVAAGLGRTRALVTSRLPLSDLDNWKRAGYGEIRIDDLEPAAAVAVLRAWGVLGDDPRLTALAGEVGNHALSVSVLGSFLVSFGAGDPAFADQLDLSREAGDDPQAARLARILKDYAAHLPADERDLLIRLSAFPRGVSVRLLGVVAGAGGEVAGELVRCDEVELLRLAHRLVLRGLAFAYSRGPERIFTAHPFLRDWFAQLLGAGAASIHRAIRIAIAPTLDARPTHRPIDTASLDRYEALIEHTRLAGAVHEAFDLYWHSLGGYYHLGRNLGECTRGTRITAGFSESGRPEDIAPRLSLIDRGALLTDWGLFLGHLGQLERAANVFAVCERWARELGQRPYLAVALWNLAEFALVRGRLADARDGATAALKQVESAELNDVRNSSYALRATALHALGALAEARLDYDAAGTQREHKYLLSRSWFARHRLDLGDMVTAYRESETILKRSRRVRWGRDGARCHALLARIGLQRSLAEAVTHLDDLQSWTARSGDMELAIESHWIAADLARRRGDLEGARARALTGLNHAEACGFGLLTIELLVLLSRTHLAWPDAHAALQYARHALDLATARECGYAWGESDAAQLCAEAHLALGEPGQARRRFEQALEVRERIEHPGADETRAALDNLAAS
jgi:tetratricopeptide (TPR) repeat protein